MMLKSALYPFALLSAFALAACGDAPDEVVSVERQPDGSATVQVQVPEQIANPGSTMESLQENAAQMSDEARLQAVQAARATAENAARLIGQSEAEITAAGDDAERSAREAMGLQ
jgi:hypothetical protein